MVRSGRWEWEAGYSDGRRVWWLYGGIALVSVASWGLMAAGVDPQDSNVVAWLWPIALVAFAVVGTRLMLPRTGRLILEGGVLRIVRGKRVTELQRQGLEIAVRDWAPMRGHELGTALELSNGSSAVTIAIRDRRVAGADGLCRSPQVWIEGAVADELLPLLEIGREVISADAPATAVRDGLTIPLLRNPNRLWPMVGLIGGMFGGMIGGAALGFAFEAWLGDSSSWLMLLVLPAVFGPMIAHLTYQRRGKVTIAVADGRVAVTRDGRTEHHELAALDLYPTHVDITSARGYGNYKTPGLIIALPGGDTLTVGTSDVRLRWTKPNPRRRSTPLVTSPLDFRLLVAALGLADTLEVDRTYEQRKLARPGAFRSRS